MSTSTRLSRRRRKKRRNRHIFSLLLLLLLVTLPQSVSHCPSFSYPLFSSFLLFLFPIEQAAFDAHVRKQLHFSCAKIESLFPFFATQISAPKKIVIIGVFLLLKAEEVLAGQKKRYVSVPVTQVDVPFFCVILWAPWMFFFCRLYNRDTPFRDRERSFVYLFAVFFL